MLSAIQKPSRPTEQFEDLHQFRQPAVSIKLSVSQWGHRADDAIPHSPQPSSITFSQYVEDKFIPEHVAHKTRAGRTHYEAMLKHALRPERVNRIFGNIPQTARFLKAAPDWPYLDDVLLSDLTPDHVKAILSAAIRRGYSAQTIKHIKNVIGAVVSHARNEGCFSRPNPAEQVKLPPVLHAPREPVSARHVFLALEKMLYPEREIALLTMYTGMSLSAICELQWKHLNLTFSFSTTSGDPLAPISIRIPASAKGVHSDMESEPPADIGIPTSVLPALLDLKWGRGDTDAEDFVFVSRSGARISPVKVRATLRKIGVSLGVPSISWQDFRNVYKKFAVEFLRKPYSTWAADGSSPWITRPSKGSSAPEVFLQSVR